MNCISRQTVEKDHWLQSKKTGLLSLRDILFRQSGVFPWSLVFSLIFSYLSFSPLDCQPFLFICLNSGNMCIIVTLVEVRWVRVEEQRVV